MKIVTLTYQRVKNLSGFEAERLEVTAEITEGEDTKKVFRELKKFVNQSLLIKD